MIDRSIQHWDMYLLKQISTYIIIIGYWDMQSLEVQQELKSDQSAQNWPEEWIEQWLTLRTGARILLLKSCKKISALANWTWPSRQLLYTTVGIWKSNLENKRARRFYNPGDVSTHFQVKLCQAGQYVWGKVAWVYPNEDVQNVAQVISSNSIEFLRQIQENLLNRRS